MGRRHHLSRSERLQLEIDRYKQSVINDRVKTLLVNRPADSQYFNDEVENARREIKEQFEKDVQEIKFKEHLRYLEKKEKVDARFKGVKDGIDQAGDIIMGPFRSVFGVIEGAQEGAFKIAGSFTNMLTSPIFLIAVGGVAYVYYTRNDEK